MLPTNLLPDIANIELEGIEYIETAFLKIQLQSTLTSTCCPICGTSSNRVHSSYYRKIWDLPWAGINTQLQLKSRRFFCEKEQCGQKFFSERFKGLAAYARRTHRYTSRLYQIGLHLGGNPGASLGNVLGFPSSPSTILRSLHHSNMPEFDTPRVLGVDDWAMRKGQVYGTILVDLESRQVVDLLPDRSAETLTAWLKSNKGVEIISRDRAGSYALGASTGAPNAIQVADRWHLLKNMTEAIQRVLDKHQNQNHQAAIALEEQRRAAEAMKEVRFPIEDSFTNDIANEVITDITSTDKSLDLKQFKFNQVKQLQKEGKLSRRKIAKQVGLNRNTVNRYFHLDTYLTGEVQYTKTSTVLPYDAHIRKRVEQGERNTRILWEEIKQMGFCNSKEAVYRYLSKYFPKDESPLDAKFIAKPYSSRKLSFLLRQELDQLEEEDSKYVNTLFEHCPAAKQVHELALRFNTIIIQQKPDLLQTWIGDAINSGKDILFDFAKNLKQDFDAIYNACSLEWSNGQVEGQVNRLKNIKRQMYGRASFELLKKRVLADTG